MDVEVEGGECASTSADSERRVGKKALGRALVCISPELICLDVEEKPNVGRFAVLSKSCHPTTSKTQMNSEIRNETS